MLHERSHSFVHKFTTFLVDPCVHAAQTIDHVVQDLGHWLGYFCHEWRQPLSTWINYQWQLGNTFWLGLFRAVGRWGLFLPCSRSWQQQRQGVLLFILGSQQSTLDMIWCIPEHHFSCPSNNSDEKSSLRFCLCQNVILSLACHGRPSGWRVVGFSLTPDSHRVVISHVWNWMSGQFFLHWDLAFMRFLGSRS